MPKGGAQRTKPITRSLGLLHRFLMLTKNFLSVSIMVCNLASSASFSSSLAWDSSTFIPPSTLFLSVAFFFSRYSTESMFAPMRAWIEAR